MTRLNHIERAALEDLFITLPSDSIAIRVINSIKALFKI
jgi:hypothetical protein